MPTFTPPTLPSPVLNRGEPEARRRRLWEYYSSPPAGVNVYLYPDGTVTTDDPITQDQWDEVRAFYGGHGPYEISSLEAARLVGAGFSINTGGTDLDDWQPDWPAEWGEPG